MKMTSSESEDSKSVESVNISLERKGSLKASIKNDNFQQSSVILQSDVFFPNSQLTGECLESMYLASSFYNFDDGGNTDKNGHQGILTKGDDNGTNIIIPPTEELGHVGEVDIKSTDYSNSINAKNSGDSVKSGTDGHSDENNKNVNTITSSLSVLVVDDSIIDRKISQNCLSGEYGEVKCVVHTAINGEMALQYCSSSASQPDIIIIDQNMESTGGVMLGTEVVENLRANYGFRDVIIIGCTGFGDKVTETFLSSGCDAVWHKPIPSRNEAMARIQKIKYERAWKNSLSRVGIAHDSPSEFAQMHADNVEESQWNKGVRSAIDSVLRKGNLEKYSQMNFAWNNDWSHIPRLTSYIYNMPDSGDGDFSDDTDKPPNFVEIRSNQLEVISELSCSVPDNNSDLNDVTSETTNNAEKDKYSITAGSDRYTEADDSATNIGDYGIRNSTSGASFDEEAHDNNSLTSTPVSHSFSEADLVPSQSRRNILECDNNFYRSTIVEQTPVEKWDPVTAFKSAFTLAHMNTANILNTNGQ